jgi:CubicO group peptidase (beta-lactamase class C family)
MIKNIAKFIPAMMMCFLMGGRQIGLAQASAPLKTDIQKKTLIAELERVIPELMTKAPVPGLSIAIIRDGQLLWTRGFGIKNAKTNEPVTEDTIFEAASLTKPFFAFAAMKMVESGQLDLDKPLLEYVPRQYLEKEYIEHSMDLEGFRKDWFGKITARMVLSHSSGLPHGEPRKPLPIFFEPGTKYRYSADGYMYLQKVIEYLKGEPLDAIMRKMVIEPLHMKDSSMVWQERYEKQAAVGHEFFGETDGQFRKRNKAHAAASLYTTATDYAQFVMALLNDTGLKGETIQEMLRPQIAIDKDISWGLGFGLEQTENGAAFWQWGDYGIFRNYIVAYKKPKIGVVYLTNSFNGLSLCQELVQQAIGGGKELGVAYLNYDQYGSPYRLFIDDLVKKGIGEAAKLVSEYRKKYPENFNELAINRVGYTFLNANRNQEAIQVFRLNVEAFPESANVYDSLAEAYMKNGDKDLAIAYCKKTLEMIPKDTKADKAFLEQIKNGALEKLKELEKK